MDPFLDSPRALGVQLSSFEAVPHGLKALVSWCPVGVTLRSTRVHSVHQIYG